MAAVLLKSSNRHLSMLHTDCHHVIIGCYNRVTASGKYLSAPDRFPRADWQHNFLVTGLNPLHKLTKEIDTLIGVNYSLLKYSSLMCYPYKGYVTMRQIVGKTIIHSMSWTACLVIETNGPWRVWHLLVLLIYEKTINDAWVYLA